MPRDRFWRGLRAALAGKHHARLEQHGFERDALPVQRMEDGMQDLLGDLAAAFDRVVAVDQHLGLDDGNEALLLADGGVAGEGMRVLLHGEPARQHRGNVVDRTPLREARALLAVALQALHESVESFGDLVTGRVRQRHLAPVNLDARNDAALLEQLRERRAVAGLLAERLLVEDHAAHRLRQLRRAEQHVAPRTPVLLGGFDADRGETFGDRGIALVGGEQALGRLHHRSDRALQLRRVHAHLLLDRLRHRSLR